MDKIHESSLEVLQKIGVVVNSRKVIDVLKKLGCAVDNGTERVRVPAQIVEKCLDTLPQTIPISDQNGNHCLDLGNGNPHCASGHNAVFMLSDASGARRGSTVKDVVDFTVLSDHLDEIDIVGVPVNPLDVTAQTALLYAIKAILENTKKPVYFSTESEQVNRAVIEMARAVLGVSTLEEKCNIICQLSPTSPLYWERGAVEALQTCAKQKVPVVILPAPIAGITAPYTLAGLATVYNAEMLSGIVISQLTNPGAGVIYGSAWLTSDMRYGTTLVGRPEASLLRIASAQMAHHYHIPSHTTSPESDASALDEQMAWEKTLSTVASLAAQNDLIMNLGMFGAGMTISLAQLVIDNEICRIVKRFVRGIEVSDDTIALKTIAQVGSKGNFLMEDHTVKHLRSGEHVELDITNAENYEVWWKKGASNIVARAEDRVGAILSNRRKSLFDSDVKRRLKDIIEKCEKVILKQQT